jgi:hypothetical protein
MAPPGLCAFASISESVAAFGGRRSVRLARCIRSRAPAAQARLPAVQLPAVFAPMIGILGLAGLYVWPAHKTPLHAVARCVRLLARIDRLVRLSCRFPRVDLLAGFS